MTTTQVLRSKVDAGEVHSEMLGYYRGWVDEFTEREKRDIDAATAGWMADLVRIIDDTMADRRLEAARILKWETRQPANW
jgi:hypothetical protein